ncbi:hypothetical protein SAMN05421759_102531 [Roseivivax lentus]|uniref:Uncharacterized protein n=1 Tax=Roseivivax lentus TaxID=633194 RepID=A0A1N7LAX6_9RHOB|nr:hypothetical protein [Roseivivax lentus]SIS70953.1 hypothetical protein SAMN05421759_102531 [Roseivivax lentus]
MTDFEKFKEFRNEITYEANLISQRVGWFITSQSFLFGALALSANRANGQIESFRGSLLFPEIPIVAILICLSSILMILASFERAGEFRDKIVTLTEKNAELRDLVSQRADFIAQLGRVLTLAVPIAVLIIWLSIVSEAAR